MLQQDKFQKDLQTNLQTIQETVLFSKEMKTIQEEMRRHHEKMEGKIDSMNKQICKMNTQLQDTQQKTIKNKES